MAAITYWVDPVSGSDVNTGTSFGDALQTQEGLIDAIQAAGNGNDYTVNLVNTGDHNYENNASINQIDGQPASTFHIRGTDSAGDPAFARVNAGLNSSINAPFLYIRDNAGILVEYIEHNTSANPGSHAFILSRDLTTGEVEFRYCKFIVTDLGSTSTNGLIRPISYSSTPQQSVIVRYCYFQNISGGFQSFYPSSGDAWTVDHCVFANYSLGVPTPRALNASFAVPSKLRATNNTFYVLGANTNSGATTTFSNLSVFSGTMAGPVYKNNVCYQDRPFWASSAFTSPTSPNPGQISDTATGDFDGTEDIGHNIYIYGPVLGAAINDPLGGDVTLYTGNPWTESPDYSAVTGFPGDVLDIEVSDAAVFVDPSSTYAWTPSGSALAITLPYDLRLSQYASAGEGGTLPGALPVNKKTDFTAQALTTKSTMYPGEPVTLRAAVSNDAGGFESAALFDIVLPSFITIVSTNATAGTYDSGTGQWTVTLAAGGAETLIFSAIVSLTATPSSEDFTVTVNAASDPPPSGNLADDTDSATLTVIARPAEESPALVPSIDALPLARPVMRLDFNTRLRTKRNRSLEHTIRDDVEQQLWSEFRSAQISIAPEATSTVNLGGVQIAEFLMVESDVAVEVSVNGTDAGSFMPAAEAVVLGEGRYTQLAIKNPSTTDTATVLVLVVD